MAAKKLKAERLVQQPMIAVPEWASAHPNRRSNSSNLEAKSSRRDVRSEIVARCVFAFLYFALSLGLTGPGPAPAFGAIQAPAEPDLNSSVIKRGESGPKTLVLQPADTLTGQNVTLRELIMWSYGVAADGIAGGPEWLDKATFDFRLKADSSGSRRFTDLQMQIAVRKILATQFKLVVHRKRSSLYALYVGENGSRLKPASGINGGQQGVKDDGKGHLVAHAATLGETAAVLGRYLSGSVLDHTDLPGNYNFRLDFKPTQKIEEGASEQEDAPPSFASLNSALKQQLGLVLNPIPVKAIVIDNAEKPAPTGDFHSSPR